jgi:DNA-directed RNA polymerase specialized sigma24 family protein
MSRSVESGHPDVVWMTTLYERHAAKLWRYAFQLTGDQARAEDVLQETLIRAWQHLQISEDQRSVGAWLFTVARNIIIDECRAPRYRNEVQSWDALGVCDSARPRRHERRAGPATHRPGAGTVILRTRCRYSSFVLLRLDDGADRR